MRISGYQLWGLRQVIAPDAMSVMRLTTAAIPGTQRARVPNKQNQRHRVISKAPPG